VSAPAAAARPGARRRWLLLALLAGASACALAGGRRVVDFEPVPEAEVAAVKNPHDWQGRPLCQRCHVRGTDRLVSHPIGLCVSCHAFGHSNHPVDVVQQNPTKELPFLEEGRLACHTCHDPHQVGKVKWALRFPFNELCKKCHTGH